MSRSAQLLRDSRIAAGLTQTQLAERIGTSQSHVARLERDDANPTVATLERAIAATGHKLQMIAPNWGNSIDASLVRRHLELPMGARIATIDSMGEFVRNARRIGPVAGG